VVAGRGGLLGALSTEVIESGPFTLLEQAMLAGDLAGRRRVHGFGVYNAVAAAAGSAGALAAALPADQRWFLAFVPIGLAGVLLAGRLSSRVEAAPQPAGAAGTVCAGPAVAAREGRHSFDAPDATYTHRGDQCTFEVLLDDYNLGGDRALARLARIVHAADITADLHTDPLGPGLLAIGVGGLDAEPDDQRLLDRGTFVYDALYAWCLRDTGPQPQPPRPTSAPG